MTSDRILRATLLALSIIAIGWVRTLPLSLGGLETQADQSARRAIQRRLAADTPTRRTPTGERQLDDWIRTHPDEFAAERAAASDRLTSQLRFTGADGREHVYLGDYDSYLWLRAARNYLRTGTTCDALVDGECRDTLTLAPVGTRMRYSWSLHIAAIVGVHRLITLFQPQYPLSASSFWVPVIVGILGALPAFAIGQRLAGPLGGLAAALLTALNPLFLQRSLGSDNDVWNVVLPLYLAWAAVTALAAADRRRGIAWAVVAAVFAALHAATWRGWVFTYAVVLAGFFAHLGLLALRALLRRRHGDRWSELREGMLILVVFVLAAGVATTVAGSEESYLRLPGHLLQALVSHPSSSSSVDSAVSIDWPDTFTTVGELSRPTLRRIAESMDGTLYFFVGWLGLILLVLPRQRWQPWHFVVLIAGNYLYRVLLTSTNLSRAVLIALLALPLLAALASSVLADSEEAEGEQRAGLLVVIWFLAALFLSYGGMRFVMLLAPPFGLAVAVAIGRLHEWLARLAARLPARYTPAARICAFVGVGTLLMLPLQRARTTATGYLPRVNDAWWDALGKLREQTPPNAIIDTWWDYGYFIEYGAERRVTADGGTLSTHAAHWLARALLAPTDREAIGLLRMLDCGSDATPEPEGRLGAFGKLVAQGLDSFHAYAAVSELAGRDRTSAQTYLRAAGIPEVAQADILSATHCSPAPAYLLLTSELVVSSAWRFLGQWDIRHAYVANHARFRPPGEAIADLVQRFGYTESAASTLYRQAQALGGPVAARQFIAPHRGYVTPNWVRCQPASTGTELICPAGVAIERPGPVLDSVVLRPDAPAQTRLRFRQRTPARGQPRTISEGTPAAVILADAVRTEEIPIASATHRGLAVLFDVPNRRVLVGPPYLLRSTFTQLMFLDGRYTDAFEKFDERTSYRGERVVTWTIKWGGRQERQPPQE